MDGLKDYHLRLVTVPTVPIEGATSQVEVTIAADPPDCAGLDSEEEIVGIDPEIQPSDDLEEVDSDHLDEDEAAIDEDESWKEAIDFASTFHNEFRYAPILSVPSETALRRLRSAYVMIFSDNEWEVCKILGPVCTDSVSSDYSYFMPVHTNTRSEYNFPSSEYGRYANSNTRWLLLKTVE
jgi:hypothetical protein